MIWAWALPADAHAPGLSSVRVDEEGLAVTLSEVEVAGQWPLAPDLEPSRLLLAEVFLDQTRVRSASGPCVVGEPRIQRVVGDGVELAAPLTCPDGAPFVVQAGWTGRFEAGHQALVEGFGQPVGVLTSGDAAVTFGHGARGEVVAPWFLRLGVEHILGGPDHLLFVVALLLGARTLGGVVWVASGFTVGHAITLSAAAMGWVGVDARWVEPAIAATLIFAAAENRWDPPARRRALLAAVMGLVHGLGLASALGAIGLPAGARLVALGTFNVGVEIGQLAVIVAVWPALVAATRRGWDERARAFGSFAVAVAGAWWLVQRW